MKNASIGIGISDISPPPEVELCGYGIYRGRRNKGVHDKLHSRSLILSADDESVVLINNDLVGMSSDILKNMRKMIRRELDIRAENIIVTCTHTHSGPVTIPLEGWGKMDEDYVESLPKKFLECVIMAYNNMREAKVGFGRGKGKGVSFNRVFPGGPIDEEVRVLHFGDENSKPIATLFNYSCHAVTTDVRTEDGFYVSADWPGHAMKFLEKKGAGQSFFLQGTCGDIDPLVAWHMRGFNAAEETGRKIAYEVLRVLDGIDVRGVEEMRVERKTIRLPLQKINMKDIVESLAKFLDQLEKREKGSIDKLRPHIRFYRNYAEAMMKKIEEGLSESLESEVQGVKLDETALVFLPGEVFIELGLEIMRRSPFKNTMIVGYSDGYVGYIPTPLDYKMAGYASTTAPKILQNPPFTEDVGLILVEETLDLLQKLTI